MGRALAPLATGMRATRIVIFVKAPVPGRVKTRLIPALGEAGAARLARDMLEATVREAKAAGLGTPELCADPDPEDEVWQGLLPQVGLRVTAQGEGDLGERLARAAGRVIGGGENVLLIGSDCPALDSKRLRAAADELETCDAFMHPTEDGGYALLGLRRFDARVFADIPWSSEKVAAETSARFEALGWSLGVGETLRDVDEPHDLPKERFRLSPE